MTTSKGTFVETTSRNSNELWTRLGKQRRRLLSRNMIGTSFRDCFHEGDGDDDEEEDL